MAAIDALQLRSVDRVPTDMWEVMCVTVTVPMRLLILEFAPSRNGDPAAEQDESDAGRSIDNWPKRVATATPAIKTTKA